MKILSILLLAFLLSYQFGWIGGICAGMFISAAINRSGNNDVHHDGWWTPR